MTEVAATSVARARSAESLPATASELTYVPGLDGLRAVAVVSVMLFHSHLAGTELGWAGVELFFVISGFLITRILLDLRERPGYFRTFYIRRALRILPLYYFVIVVSIAIAVALGRPIASMSLPFYAVYLQNYVPQIASSMREGIPLTTQTWTLAVEEQFYWLWPLVILVARGARLRYVLIACVVAAPLARLALLAWTGNPLASVAALPAQVDALAAGAALALAERAGIGREAMRRWGARAAVAGGLLVAGLVLRGGLATFADSDRWAADPVNALLLSGLAALFAGVVALTLVGRGRVLDLLEWAPLAHVGKISYGLYIYGPLSLVAASVILTGSQRLYVEGGLAVTAVGAALCYALAFASFRYFEMPIRRRGNRLAGTERREPRVSR